MSNKLKEQLKNALEYIDVLEHAIELSGHIVSDAVYDNIIETDFDYSEAKKILNKED